MQHIYVHVPFCARRCVYCDFAIAVRRQVPGDRYVKAVVRELEWRTRGPEWDDQPLETLYLGGGTPSLLPPGLLVELIRAVSSATSRRVPDPEVTVEANPDDVTPRVVSGWVAAGVTRVSMGVQSFADHVLEWMHRTHRVAASEEGVRALRANGVRSVSLDLIFGLPDALKPDLARDLARAIELEPDHLSVYGLTLEPQTALTRWVARGATRTAGHTRYQEEFLLAHETLTGAGYEHYEVSNYARPRHQARHNGAYWTGRPYAGLGPSAHSYWAGERRWNLSQWSHYESAVVAGRDPISGRERLTFDQARLERVYLGLRTREGVECGELSPESRPVVRSAQSQGWLVATGDRIRLTPQGWLRLDQLATSLTTLPESG